MSIDLSLSRLSNLFPHLPHRYSRPTIHIAGTNGKGSVSALVSSILKNSEIQPRPKVGRFNSPHLVDITDCILIDETPVEHQDFAQMKESVIETDRVYGMETSRLTPFEVLTLTALQLFEKAEVDVAVVEVGMGGRLDATNVIPSSCILVSALTSVDLDHQGFLGNRLSEIATQKAGIARPRKPFVFGPQKPGNRAEVEGAVLKTVAGAGARLVEPVEVVVGEREHGEQTGFTLRPLAPPTEFIPPPGHPVAFTIPSLSAEPIAATLRLQGAHQFENLSTALGIVQALVESPPDLPTPRSIALARGLTPESIRRGIADGNWRGRLSWHVYTTSSLSMPVLVDGAHNPASSETLRGYLLTDILSVRPRVHITYIIALSHSPPKTPRDTLAPLFSLSSHENTQSVSVAFVPFTRPTDMPWVKSVAPRDLVKVIDDMDRQRGTARSIRVWERSRDSDESGTLEEGNLNTWLEDALSWAGMLHSKDEEHLVVVAGSLYLVADFYRLLGGSAS